MVSFSSILGWTDGDSLCLEVRKYSSRPYLYSRWLVKHARLSVMVACCVRFTLPPAVYHWGGLKTRSTGFYEVYFFTLASEWVFTAQQFMERMGLEAKSHRNRCPAEDQEEYTFTIQPVSFNLMARVAKLTDSPVNSNIYIRDEAVKGTISDDEKQTNQSNTNHAKLITEQSDEPSGMELLTQIADRFRGLKCSTRASVMIAGREVILPIPDCVAATAPREIVMDGVSIMWPWDWDVSEELLELARRDERSFLHSMGGGIGLLRVKSGLEDQVAEIIRKLRSAA